MPITCNKCGAYEFTTTGKNGSIIGGGGGGICKNNEPIKIGGGRSCICKNNEPIKIGDKITFTNKYKRRTFWQWLTRKPKQLQVYIVTGSSAYPKYTKE